MGVIDTNIFLKLSKQIGIKEFYSISNSLKLDTSKARVLLKSTVSACGHPLAAPMSFKRWFDQSGIVSGFQEPRSKVDPVTNKKNYSFQQSCVHFSMQWQVPPGNHAIRLESIVFLNFHTFPKQQGEKSVINFRHITNNS